MASQDNREISHHFTLGADLVLFIGLSIYVASMSSKADKNAFDKYVPTMFVIIGSIFTILDPFRHFLLDHGGIFFPEEKLAMFDGPGHLSWIGQLCRLTSKMGLVMLVAGIILFLQMPATLLSCLLPRTYPSPASSSSSSSSSVPKACDFQ